jgi:hypothetical protein
MAKWSGKIGFATHANDGSDVWTEEIEERSYKGDLLQNFIRNQPADKLNDDLTITNKISIVADLYADQNFPMMRYATIKGVKWKITNVEVLRPRLILTVGGVYNG